MNKTKKIALAGLLFAMLIVLSRFLSIKTPFVTISFSFIPVIISAIYLGPKWTVLITTLSDIVGAIFFPYGQYFIGFTISSAMMGLIYGVLLYKKPGKEYSNKVFLFKIILSTLLVSIGVNLLLNSLWLNIMYEKAFIVLLSVRVVKELVMMAIEIPVIFAIYKGLNKIAEKYLID